jgi:hypothetical protein
MNGKTTPEVERVIEPAETRSPPAVDTTSDTKPATRCSSNTAAALDAVPPVVSSRNRNDPSQFAALVEVHALRADVDLD